MVTFFAPGETKLFFLRAIDKTIQNLRKLEHPKPPNLSKRNPIIVKPKLPQKSGLYLCDQFVGEAPSYPLCLFFTHNRCRLTHEKLHTEKYTHSFPDLSVDPKSVQSVPEQPFSCYVVLHVVGEDEIVEMCAVLIDSNTLEVIDRFHRFVRPRLLIREQLLRYITQRYGPWKLQSTWGLLSRRFTQTLKSFERWLESHELLVRGTLRDAALVAFEVDKVLGKVEDQCKVWGISIPPYLSTGIDLKDNLAVYSTRHDVISGRVIRGMISELQRSELGLDGAHNVARILQRVVCDRLQLRVRVRARRE